MRTIRLFDGSELALIGLGTWRMGGDTRADPSQDGKTLRALRLAFEMGYRHIDTAEMYAAGHCEELIGRALRGQPREEFFITSKVKPENLRYKSVLRSLEGSLRRMGVAYIDLYLIHWPSGSIPLADSFRALNQAVREGKVRYLGVSNFDLHELKEAQRLSETPLVTNQVPYSLFERHYVWNGVIPYCQENNILVTAYSPVKDRRLTGIPQIERIAAAYQATPYQIALAWLVNQPGVITIPMSQDEEHLRQNLAAADILLSREELAVLDRLDY